MTQRERFEAWAEEYGLDITRYTGDNDYYEEPDTSSAWDAWQAACPNVDELAQHIRQVDGNHAMGAGALAESICEWMAEPKPGDV